MADVFDFYVRDNRKINFEIAEPIMREDSGVTDFRFHIPKTLNGLEVSDWSWWFVFVNANKEKYSIALTLSDDPERPLEYNLATYTVDYAMSIKAGSVQFALEAINAGTGGAIDNEWHTLTYQTTVKETLQGNQVDYDESQSDIISALIQEVQRKVNSLVGGATPIPVNLKSLMTDHDKVYLYTGSEPDYEYGYWYYHDETGWHPGGEYASTALTVDATLSEEGQAADAKAVGDALVDIDGTFTTLRADIDEIYTGKQVKVIGVNKLDVSTIENAKLQADGGVIPSANNKTSDYIPLKGTDKTSIAFTGLNYAGTKRISLNAYRFVFYNTNKEFILQTGATQSNTIQAFPDGCKYVRVCVENSYINSRQPMVEFVDSLTEISSSYREYGESTTVSHGLNYIDDTQQEIQRDLADLQEEVSDFSESTGNTLSAIQTDVDALNDKISSTTSDNLFSTYTQRAYWKSDGTQVTNDSWVATDGIDVSEYESITYADAGNPGSTPCCLWTDSNDDVISHFFQDSAGETLAVPGGAKYVKFSLRQEQKELFNIVGSRTGQLDKNTENIEALISEVSKASGDIAALDLDVSKNTKDIDDIVGATNSINNIGTFQNGSIMTVDGRYNSDRVYWYRVTTPEIVTINTDIKIDISPGYRLYAAYFSEGAYTDKGWVKSGAILKSGTTARLMVARTTEDTSEIADVSDFCSSVTYTPVNGLESLVKNVAEIKAVVDIGNPARAYGMTWDWWISAHSVDKFGNVYIGYVDSDGYAGILRRQPDGSTQYKRLENLANNDDHNSCATYVLPDGRVLAVGSYGHTANNHIVCWRSTKAYSIEEMEQLSFDIPQDGDYTYKTCYSQLFEYDGVLFDFMRFGSISKADPKARSYGFACIVSTDYGTTWSVYKVFNGTDAYNAMAQCTDDPKYLKVVVGANPASGSYKFKGCYIDLSTYKIYDLNDTEIGEMVPLNSGPITDNAAARYGNMTYLAEQTQNNLMGRLFFTAPTPKSDTVFIFATAVNTAGSDFIYKRYKNGQVSEFGNSGVGFGNVHYISGACFGNSPDTLYYSKATTSKADGNHELHKVKISNNVVASDEIITEASMCILRPLFLGNGELATVVGHYNDQNSDGTYNGSFTAWELKPMFTRA